MRTTGYKTEAEALAMAQARLHEIENDSRYFRERFEAVARYYDFGEGDPMTGWSPTILGLHIILKRDKPGRPWSKAGECMASCSSDAMDQAGIDGINERNRKVVSASEWHTIQTKQHLRKVGIKA